MNDSKEQLFDKEFLGKRTVMTCCPECGHISSSDYGYHCYCGCERVIFTPMKRSVYDGLRPAAKEAWRANTWIKYCEKVLSFDQRAYDAWLRKNGGRLRAAYREIVNESPDCVSGVTVWPGAKRAQQPAQQVVRQASAQAYTPRCPTCGPPNIGKARMYWGYGRGPTFCCHNCGYEW